MGGPFGGQCAFYQPFCEAFESAMFAKNFFWRFTALSYVIQQRIRFCV